MSKLNTQSDAHKEIFNVVKDADCSVCKNMHLNKNVEQSTTFFPALKRVRLKLSDKKVGLAIIILLLLSFNCIRLSAQENLDIEIIDNKYVGLEVEEECPAIMNFYYLAWGSSNNYLKYINLYISIDGGPEVLAYHYEQFSATSGDWLVQTPLSTLLGYEGYTVTTDTGNDVIRHDGYIQIPYGSSVSFRTEGIWYYDGNDEERGDIQNVATYEFPAPGAARWFQPVAGLLLQYTYLECPFSSSFHAPGSTKV